MSITTNNITEQVHRGQDKILESDARFRIVACGRRWGKTSVCAKETRDDLIANTDGWLTWWVAPTYQQAKIGFRELLGELPDQFKAGVNRSELRVESTTGAVCVFKSSDQPDNLRGEGVDKLVVDEAGDTSDYAYEHALRPTLTDSAQSRMIAIGTPRTRNWFFRLYQRGDAEDWPEYESFRGSTYENPFINRDDIEEAKRSLPRRTFEQEYLAEFKDESGGVFTDLNDRLFTLDGYPTDPTPPFAHGWDFARHQDFLVGVVIDADGRLVDYNRSQNDAWPQIQQRIERIAAEYPGVVALDATRDNKIVADLADALGESPVDPVSFSPKRKRELIEDLIATIEAGELAAPDIQQLHHELAIFEYDVTPSGNIRYEAPEGFHDDSVDALALAVSQFDRIAVAHRRRQDQLDTDDRTPRDTGAYSI